MSAKFRRNHASARGQSGFGRIMIFALVAVISLYFLSRAIGNLDLEDNLKKNINFGSFDSLETLVESSHYKVQVIDHGYFELGYDEKIEQARYVGYGLNSEMLSLKNVPRTDWFSEDKKVESRSSHHRDFTNSGYSRGHLVPAADMAHSEESMATTFLMSNISPQLRHFNGGVWRELEELVRDWVYKHDALYIISGPLFLEDQVEYIGKTSQIAVPSHFFKALLTENWEGVAFVVPHALSTESIEKYMVSIDSLERLSQLEMFDLLIDDSIEIEIEKTFDSDLWPIDESRYRRRIEHWNNN